MRNRLSVVVLLGVSFAAPVMAQDPEAVWVWNPFCSQPTALALQVRLDGEAIYSTSLPLCLWRREFEEGKASFRFVPTRPLVWHGYRSDPDDGSKDPGDTTPAGTKLDVEFWQAGGEPDQIELGYSVAAPDGLHMNAVHILLPTERSKTTMAPGLVIETWPESKP